MLNIGIDIGSTTAKILRLEDDALAPSRSVYVRHRGDPLGVLREQLVRLRPRPSSRPPHQGRRSASERVRLAITGSAGRLVAERLGVRHVHEVSAIVAAAARREGAIRALIDIGGQDAKLVLFARDGSGRLRRTHSSMNERCGAGTGVTIDRCLLRLGLAPEQARKIEYDPNRVRPVSSKCGVFAETDLVVMARAGVCAEDLVVSLADAIVLQNLSVLARGLSIEGPVLLLGGPNVHFPALAGAWRHHLARLAEERSGAAPEELEVRVPVHALEFAALGALDLVPADETVAKSVEELLLRIDSAPVEFSDELRQDRPFTESNQEPAPRPRPPRPKSYVYDGVAVGIDAGSTASKAVALDAAGAIVASTSVRSTDPIANAQLLLLGLEEMLKGRPIAALGVTGYGAPLIEPVLGADVRVVETVAHARSARAYVPDAEVVADVGGQDIKLLALDRSGAIVDFRLSTQCNAGLGMVLEATARELGIGLDDIAERAFKARRAPRFSDGCAVFLDADRVSFQRQGFSGDEIIAGMLRALPRLIWNEIMNGTPPASLGKVFILQGGLQKNRAALVAQIEHLVREVPGCRVEVHPHPAEAGAIGAALVALDAQAHVDVEQRRTSSPSGPIRIGGFAEALGQLRFSVRSDASTRCTLCESGCPRTLIELDRGGDFQEAVMVGQGCPEGGAIEIGHGAQKRVRAEKREKTPNLLAEEAARLFAPERGAALREMRRRVRIGIPRVLSMYRAAPFVRGYLEALGVRPEDVLFSPPTSAELWREGAGHGASDPCFPVKVSLAHVHHLLYRVHDGGRPLDAVLVPSFTHAVTPVHGTDCASCPVVAASPALVSASFGVSGELGVRGIELLDGAITLTEPELLRAQMFAMFGELLEASQAESDAGVQAGFARMRRLDLMLQAKAQEVLQSIDRGERRAAVLVLCRPYHADPGINHRVGEEVQSLGYPVLSIRSLPRDPGYLGQLFARDLAERRISDPFDVDDLHPESANSGANERLWAARFAARHGRLGVIDLSSFKCTQDAPVAHAVRSVLDDGAVVSCALHDLDETRPVGSLRLKLSTFAHALRERGLSP
jgi:predicted CoA-substrate-specific enzyme activase